MRIDKLALLSGFFLSAPAMAAQSPAIPTVSIEYGAMFDFVCSEKSSYKIDPRWVQELEGRLPALRREWEAEGRQLLKMAAKISGRPFIQKELAVTLTLCSFPSMGQPLLVNARYTMKTFVENPNTDQVFLSTIFHEILHAYLDGFKQETPLIKKYRMESEGVKSHLHLLALQKAVYLKLGRNAVLKDVIAKDQSLPRPDYKRAWEIVNGPEGYESFIHELKR